MSIKSLIQVLLILLIFLVVGLVYYEYFNINKKNVQEIEESAIITENQFNELEKKIEDLEIKNKELISKVEENKNITQNEPNLVEKKIDINNQSNLVKEEIENNKNLKNDVIENSNKSSSKNKNIKNLVKDVEYISVDEKGNKFYLLATSGKSNTEDNNILDLENVRGKILSDFRDTIYIVSDFAQYNSKNLNSKFYQNVIIDYQDKKITCLNFIINMETNMAIAYNNVVITDPKSIMKAGVVEFDLKTKDINIKPESINEEIKVITN